MDFPGFVEDHPAISIVVFLVAVFAVLGFVAVNFTQMTFADGGDVDPCSWQEAPNETKQDFRDYVQENGGTVPEGMKFEYRSGGLYYRTPCGTVGGGSSQ